MLLLQTDYLVMEVEINTHTNSIPLTVIVQCNGKMRRTRHYLHITTQNPKDWENMTCGHSTTKSNIDWLYYDLSSYSCQVISTITSTLKDLGYEIQTDANDIMREIVKLYVAEITIDPELLEWSMIKDK